MRQIGLGRRCFTHASSLPDGNLTEATVLTGPGVILNPI